MTEALWQLVGWDLVDYCIIIQWAHDFNSTDNFDTTKFLQPLRGAKSNQVTSRSWQEVRRVVKCSQVNVRFIRGNWPEASWMRGQPKTQQRELCCRLSTGEPGWIGVTCGPIMHNVNATIPLKTCSSQACPHALKQGRDCTALSM